MNPALFNKRIRFLKETTVINQYGGSDTVLTPLLTVSTAPDPSTTWGSLEPLRQWHQERMEAGASVMNGDILLKMRKRKSFTPDKTMVFQDVSEPGNTNPDTYNIVSVMSFWPGTKAAFQNNQETAYHDQYFVQIVGVKRG